MSRKVNIEFEVAPEKRDKFLKATSDSKAVERAMARAAKNVQGFGRSATKRK